MLHAPDLLLLFSSNSWKQSVIYPALTSDCITNYVWALLLGYESQLYNIHNRYIQWILMRIFISS